MNPRSRIISMREVFRPALHLGETYWPVRFDGGAMADAVVRVCHEGEYDGVEIADIAASAFRWRRRLGHGFSRRWESEHDVTLRTSGRSS